MRKAALLMLGATPGVAVGYFLLLAYILNRVKPLPITFLPEIARESLSTRGHLPKRAYAPEHAFEPALGAKLIA